MRICTGTTGAAVRALATAVLGLAPFACAQNAPLLTGQAAFTDWSQQAPGVRHKITVADLPQPKPDESANNQPRLVPRPADAWPIAPAGFKVTLYAGGDNGPLQRSHATEHMARAAGTFTEPRFIMTAPNGDLFLADSGAGIIDVLRGVSPDGKAQQIEHFASGLDHPFGIAFYPAENPRYVYIGNATTVVRFPYHSGDLHASGPAETIVPDVPGYAQLAGGGHWTRDVTFSKDGKHLLVSVGSASNVDDADTHPREFHRADILEYTPEGKFEEVYAHGIRNCVSEAVNPITGELWCSVNERDQLGNHLVPDYVTSVPEGSFFGWPWYYMGGHRDPRLPDPCADGTGPDLQLKAPLTQEQAANCKRVDMSAKVRTPDVPVQPHMASLEMLFYPTRGMLMNMGRPPDIPGLPPIKGGGPNIPSSIFPPAYEGGAFVAEHGSWNRSPHAGYEVIFIPTVNGRATGEYDDFLTGFVTRDGQVWGRPVGVAVGKDGSLFVTDDGSRSIWHVTAQPSGLAAILAQMDAASANFHSAQASIRKDQFEKIVLDTTTETGTIYFQRSGATVQMGAKFDPPAAQTVEYKGGLVRLYTPSTNHVEEYSATGKDQAQVDTFVTLGFGGSGKDLARAWTITDQGSEQIADGGKPVKVEKLDLVSQDPSVRSTFTHITIWIDPVRDVALKQESFAPGGDTNTVTYSNIRLNQPIDLKAYAIKCKGPCN